MTRRLAAAALGTLTLAAGLLGAPAALHTAAPSLQQQLDRAGTDLPFDPLLASVSCPVERGLVKEGADPDRFKVSSAVVSTSIAGLRAKPKPSVYPQRNRIAPVELHVYQVAATLTQYKQESDGDVHLVLKDSAGRSMIAEIPYGACASGSRWRSQIVATRSAFAARFRGALLGVDVVALRAAGCGGARAGDVRPAASSDRRGPERDRAAPGHRGHVPVAGCAKAAPPGALG